jgi:anti-anti-sigma factor
VEIATRIAGKALVAEVRGKVDTISAADFEKGLAAALKGEEKILILVLGGLEYISSAGLRVILSSAKTIKSRGGELRLAGASGSVKKVLQISGFFTMFKNFDSVEAALADT